MSRGGMSGARRGGARGAGYRAGHGARPVGRTALAAAAVAAALLVSGCSSLFGPVEAVPGEVSVPDPDFSSYTEQVPQWSDCGERTVCADVYAPLDWTDPSGERITLRLAKHPAESGTPLGTLFVNLGGPGGPGADGVRYYVNGLVTQQVREQYDVIGWDPRGVGASSAVYCLDDAGLDDFIYGTGDPEADGANLEFGSDAWVRMSLDANAEFGAACAKETGALLGHVDTLSTVKDLDMLRGVVGDEKLNYLGYSYGTRIGALYADEFPERSGRLVLDGAMDPAADITEIARQQVISIEAALRAYVADCLTRSGCPLSGTVERGMQRIGELFDQVDEQPIRAADGRLLYDSTLFTAFIAPLYAQQRWPELNTLISEVSKGKAEQAFRLADSYNDRVGGVYQSNLIEAFTAINCVDYPRPESLDVAAMRADAAETIRLAPITGRFQTFGDLGCARWPVPAVDVTGPVSAAGADPILVVGTTGDPATPYRWAQSLAEQLESGVLLTFVGEGHTAYMNDDCVDRVVDDYLLTGATPAPASARCG